ncbi:MAG: AsnC family transcriptional regulator [Anaerolineae bacterium]|nr:AsnC family transcriptional regulator [Anaerolineae bacterium]MCB9158972.1 AsnC family transcriptional regulator [Caldilineaceae bacterium]
MSNDDHYAGADNQSVLAFVDADIMSGKDELAREELLRNVRRYKSTGVSPLWVNWLRQRADLRFVCLVRDLAEFNDFMLDVVRSVDGVRETRTMLSFGGRADIDTLLDLEMEVSPNSQMVASSVLIDVRPGLDRQCFQTLLDLPPHPDVRRVWLLNCYHSDDADLMMLLLGKNVAALTGYVMSWIRTADGVVDTEMSTVLDWRWLASPDTIVELCELFFTHNYRGQFRSDGNRW